VVLRLRKPVRADGIYVHLLGKEWIWRPAHDYCEASFDGFNDDIDIDYRLAGNWMNICKKTVILGGRGVYSHGEYSFKIPVPNEAGEPLKDHPEIRSSRIGYGPKSYRKWFVKAVLDVPGTLDISTRENIKFKERIRYRRMKVENEETEIDHSWVDMDDRRTRSVIGFKDTPHDEVIAEGVRLCPQCEIPYHPKRGRRQCDHCGTYLP